MTGEPDSGLAVRVLDASGTTVGAGVLVGPREILTCAHVVNSALGRDRRAQDQPVAEDIVEFAIGDHPRLRARVQRWLPPPRAGAIGDDIVGLVVISTELPPGVVPARLAVNPPARGRMVDVFGYPGDPPRPDGAWVEAAVRGQVGGRHLQLDSTPGSALRIQPGFSGSPVYDRGTGRVVGLLTTAAPAASGQRDSYAITAERLRLAWPEVLDPRYTPTYRQAADACKKLTVLHVSDLRFGRTHLVADDALTPVDQTDDIVFRRLHEDLDRLVEDPGLRPDLVVVTGDLTERGLPSEFDQVVQFLTALTEAVQLPRRHVAIVPGNHDVSRDDCAAYFLEQRAAEREPVAPYWRKWKHFAAAFEQFYEGVDGVSFTPDEPWRLFEMPDLGVVVAGLNSTMADSHRDADHYGWLGEHQLRWFAEHLAGYQDQGWLRLAAVHHNAVRGAVTADDTLKDADDLDRRLGRPGLVNLLLQGHTHDGRLHRLSSGLPALATGSAAVTTETPPQEVPHQYQLLAVHSSGVTRHARQYASTQYRWIGDTRVSPDGPDHIAATFPVVQRGVTDSQIQRSVAGEGFFDRVLEATRMRYPEATVIPRPEAGYVRVSNPVPDWGTERWPVGVVDGTVSGTDLATFVRHVHRQFASADPSVPSELVYSGLPATEDMVLQALRQGVRLRSIIDYEGLVDLRPLLARQATRLATDPIYPAELYVPQRYRLIDDEPDTAARDNVLPQVIDWLGADGARFIMLLGDFGRGKTFLLRELARTLPQHLPGLLPVLVELRSLEKAPSSDELLAQHLVREKVNPFDITKLRYMIRRGRLALLFDGFDELELRIGYDNAADYLNVVLRAVRQDAKVVLTSRTQHFRSTAQIRTALGDQVAALGSSRVAVLEDFTEKQILQFLANHYGGNMVAARDRSALLDDVRDLHGLSRNPRMLSFIADLDEQRLRAIQAEHGQISAAELYRELVDWWLFKESDRHQHPGGLPSLGETGRLAACTALARRLWATTASTIPLAEFTAEVADTLTHLADLGYTVDQAAHTVGLGTLLVRTEEEFAFVHQSVMEWLVANSAAERLQHGHVADILHTRRMSTLMVDFLCDLAGHEVSRRWAADVLADPAASKMAKQNGLAVAQRLGPGSSQELAGVDLRSQDLTNRDLRNTNLQGADLHGMRLVGTNFAGADLRGANLTGARMVGGDLHDAQVSESQWNRAALLGVSGLDSVMGTPELAVAAVAGQDPADVMIAPTGDVSSVAFCPDSSLLAIARGPSVEIIDVANTHPLRVLSGHTGGVRGVAFSPDGTVLATASDDHTVRLWDPTTGQHRDHALIGHTGGVRGVAFSPDGTVLATASDDHTVRLWDPTTGQHRTTLTGHTGGVRGVAFSPDGSLLATTSDDRTARLWDPTTGQHNTTLTGHTGEVTGVAFSPRGALLATASADHTARLWEPATGQHRTTLTGHTGEVRGVAFSPDGSLLATTSDDHTVRLWEPATGQHATTLTGHTDWVTGVAFSPGGTRLATTSADGTVRLWDPATGQHATTLTGHTSPVPGVTFSPKGNLLATASADGTVRLWDPASGQHHTRTGHPGWAIAVTFSSDGTRLATVSDDGTVWLWDPATSQHPTTLTGNTGRVRGVAFSPDGTRLATTSTDGTARLWDPTTGQRRDRALIGHAGPVWGVAFSPDGALLATASDDHTVRLWDLTGLGRHLRRYRNLTGHTDWVRGVAFSADGTQLATGSTDRTVRLWDPATGEHRRTLTGHHGWVRGVAFSPDDTLLATASDDGTARLWDLRTGEHRAVTLTGHTGRVTGVTFSPDGTMLATASADGTARLWDPTTGAVRATLLALKAGGYAVLLPDGSYKLAGDPGRALWWAIKLCRFAPGDLDPHDPAIRRLSADDPLHR